MTPLYNLHSDGHVINMSCGEVLGPAQLIVAFLFFDRFIYLLNFSPIFSFMPFFRFHGLFTKYILNLLIFLNRM